MSSIVTNASALTALKTMNPTSKSLSATQSRFSTGQRVAQSSDNAAYWLIAKGDAQTILSLFRG